MLEEEHKGVYSHEYLSQVINNYGFWMTYFS